MRYPEGLVHEYGAKAGILLYVARELPDIPQAPMVVSKKNESAEDFLERVGKPEFRLPWLVRSSAGAELYGYEGELPTLEESDPDHLKTSVRGVQNSPYALKKKGLGQDLPDQINVIIAEKMKSKYTGTYIKHPNIPDFYLMSFTRTERDLLFGAVRFSYSYQLSDGRPTFLESFTNPMDHRDAPFLGSEIKTIMSWHDRIASLPEMDPTWAYQVEFGLYPTCLFQVRPFKPLEEASFELPKDDLIISKPIVIGITSPEGIIARVRRLRYNFAFEMLDNLPSEDEPVVAVDNLKSAELARHLPNHKANLFGDAYGFLQHKDIAAMRRADVTALYNSSPDIHGACSQGDWLKIISDGRNIIVKNIG